jgi:hypothetical protein
MTAFSRTEIAAFTTGHSHSGTPTATSLPPRCTPTPPNRRYLATQHTGTAFSTAQADLLRQLPGARQAVTVVFDGDNAGHTAAECALTRLSEHPPAGRLLAAEFTAGPTPPNYWHGPPAAPPGRAATSTPADNAPFKSLPEARICEGEAMTPAEHRARAQELATRADTILDLDSVGELTDHELLQIAALAQLGQLHAALSVLPDPVADTSQAKPAGGNEGHVEPKDYYDPPPFINEEYA